jgi:hypothetical protein
MSKFLKLVIPIFLIAIIGWLIWLDWDLEKYRNLAVIIGVIIALIVYITNSYYQYKQRVSDNALRYMELHDKIFENDFLKTNIQAMEKGEVKRTAKDELNFNRLLGDIEKLAFLSKTGVVSQTINIYMFGWFASHIQPLIKQEERDHVFWEVAVNFLDDLKKDADDFYKLTKKQRNDYFNKNHFFH